MDFSEVSTLTAEADELLGKLLEEALGLLRNFDTSSPETLEETIRRREEILERFLKLEGRIAILEERAKGDELNRLKALRESRAVLAGRIQETDSLVIALAREQLSVIKGDLAALTQGRRALYAYEGRPSGRSHTVNDSA
ncbi:hypothetical protein [Geobacter benzoatilyticus]|uniref:Flagellar biosynthesis protein FlgN n=1 Tax=Geobacter benzoatilyticus TaxID=2815309 RepID=A0ABX7Q812_9BACT|nr:hypothetical protein [Geobacter benzoatilyticus]QSV47170.1 hypothetical protein JZM60_07895 [Geobacter benzoatilyticus]